MERGLSAAGGYPDRPRPRVSVVVPNYNHGRFLAGRLRSVLDQSFRDFEVLLLDDASTDDSAEVIARFAGEPRVRVARNERNSGSTFAQWNRGVRLARGELVWFAESDDLADPRLLERLVGALDANPGCGVACCESWLFEGQGEPAPDGIRPHYRPGDRREFWTRDFVADGVTICARDLLYGNAIPNASAVVVRRALYERVGGADESMRQCGDWLLWARMLAESSLAHVGARMNYYRTHDASVRAKAGATAATIGEVYAVLRFIRANVPLQPGAFQRALRHHAGYFARASAARSVPVAAMIGACARVADVDPRIVRRLLLPFLRQRTLRLARRASGAARAATGGKALRSAGPDQAEPR